MKKKLAIITLIALMCMASVAEAESIFPDMKESCWAYLYVCECKWQGYIDGFPDGTYKGQNTLKANEFLKILAAYFNRDNMTLVGGGGDGESSWFTPYWEVCKDIGLIDGSKDATQYGYELSREEAAYYMSKFVALRTSGDVGESQPKLFKDAETIKDDYLEAVYDMASKGFIEGYQDGTFNPKKILTRYEAAKLIYGLISRNINTALINQ